ncbi:N-acetylglucosaminyl deacetylase, LmbE family [Cryobacterium psychrotolerans]|uniref:N-acetylglucosaminyl deacetylase, LmbE family n=1 Tax=Cryobacterium psychrotolerans TaxID=386301 RepID=A0A1G9DLH8_9MICO|nr:PIG-L family deacetylase [Cryobacterium psychrotolerans]TFD85358.1 methyltransferase domain-containing protein [Cryobacterium psychrotolerans]SDK64746.1 N-acetylglucosaminyl deacetylase, LmbE family [Cryobacterium psychrotolerans]
MVTFGHQDVGTAEAVWAAGRGASAEDLPIDDLQRLVVVAAHPDDETLGAGGLIARAARAGVPVTVVVLSNGEASHPGSTTHSRKRLSALRRREVASAVAALAPGARLCLLDLPDGALAEHGEEAARAVAAELGPGGPGAWIVAPWQADGHPDHAAAGAAAHAANRLAAALGAPARVFEYPIWAWHWSTPGDPVWPVTALRTLELEPQDRERKSRAMQLHRSQVEPLSERAGDEAIIQPAFGQHFSRGYETFIESTEPESTEPESTEPEARPAESLAEPFFDEFYAGETDPWGFETRWYEKRKRALTLAALPRERFTAALELGCSIGVLTAELADRCTTVDAVDIAEQPLRTARARLAGRPGVTFTRRTLPGEWPEGSFDLIVLSEVGYYFSPAELRDLLERCRAGLAPDGVLLACHWRHPVGEYPLTGDRVHEELGRLEGLERTVAHRERDFLLEVFEPAPARSVAQREGLAP